MSKQVTGIFFLLSFLGLVIHACKHDPTEIITTGPVPQIPVTPNDSVCFNSQILPLFVSNCTMSACHDAITHADGYNFTTYNGIKSGVIAFQPDKGNIIKSITDTDPKDRMPPAGPLSAAQIQLIKKWISEGATNRICSNVCDTLNVKYTTHITQVIQSNCLGCHSGTSISGGVDLSTYSMVRNETISGKLLCTINQQGGCSAMPKNGTKLNYCDLRKFEIWKNTGTPQ